MHQAGNKELEEKINDAMENVQSSVASAEEEGNLKKEAKEMEITRKKHEEAQAELKEVKKDVL